MADASRESKIQAQQAAIQRRLDIKNNQAKRGSKNIVKGGKGSADNYQYSYIRGADEGYSKSDYGIGGGAAIPYQVGTKTRNAGRIFNPPKSKPPAKVYRPPAGAGPKTRKRYTVKRGDTISSIAAKNGMTWQDIWDYNLKNRSAGTVRTLKKRGPNLIYKGSTFYIPNK